MFCQGIFAGKNAGDRNSALPNIITIKEGKVFIESHLIAKALASTNGNKSQAAELLEISYPSLLSKIKEYNLALTGKDSDERLQIFYKHLFLFPGDHAASDTVTVFASVRIIAPVES